MSHTLTETGKVLTETNFDALCDLLPSKTNWGDTLTPGIVEQIALAEREACAKGCEQLSHIGSENQLWMRDRCAAFIRSRSNVELTSGPHGVYVGGSGDGYYCKKCDAELTKAGTDKKHKAYLGIASLRLEAAAWSADFERRRKDAEAKMERHNAKSQATDAALSRRVRLIDGFGGTG